jgi:hypothetical protein
MEGVQPDRSILSEGFAAVVAELMLASSTKYKSAVTRYTSLASMEGLGGFITMIRVVTGASDAGEEELSKPFLIVTGPPVVPMQLSSDASVFLSADIGMEGVAGSPWPSPRVYPFVLPAQRSTRSCRPQDLP